MDYEKKYKEALERARKWYNDSHITIGLKGNLKDIFPELAEPKDEKIRKEIKVILANTDFSQFALDYTFADMINWLEKQKEHNSFFKEIEHDDCLEADKAEPKFHIGDKIRFFRKGTTNEEPMTITKIDEKGYWSDDLFICNFIDADKRLELVEQKPADEPKFHKGDWVVYNNDICQIVKREEGCNILVTQFGIEKEPVNERNLSTAKLWEISCAKDGDVLAFKNNIGGIIICKSPTNYDTGSYCRLICDNLINKEESGWDSTLLVPATKEQRDALYKAMADAGYTFDFDKKELKKINNK